MPEALFYLRVSTDDQSVEQQRPALAAYYDYALAPRGFSRGAEYVDEGVSAGQPFLSRPAAVRLAADAERGDSIVIAKLDRAFRDTRDCLATVDVLDARGVGLHLLDLPVTDLSSAMGRMCLTFGAAVAEFERRRMGERMRESIRSRRMRGLSGCNPPYGYKSVGPRGARRCEKDPAQRRLGAAVVAWKEKGWSFHAIAQHLRDLGEVNPRTKEPCSQPWVKKIYYREKRLQARDAAEAAVNSPQTS